MVEHNHPDAGLLRQTRPPAQFSGTPNQYRMGGPRLGQHTHEVLSEAGIDQPGIQQLLDSGAAMVDSEKNDT